MTEITQADRDAAEEHFDLWYPNTAWGYEPLVEAFARHRQQAIEALQADNARLRETLVVLRDLPIVENDETDTLHLNGETHTGPVVDWLFYAVRKIKAVAEAALQETGQ